MAIKNTVAIELTSGISIPSNNVIISVIHFPQVIPVYDENGVYIDKIRKITYDLLPYVTEADIITEGKTYVGGQMVDFPTGGWEKDMTDEEYADLLADGALAEVWLKDYIKSVIGGNPTIIDPY